MNHINQSISIFFLFFFILFSCQKDDLVWNLKKLPEFDKIEIDFNTSEGFKIKSTLKSDGNDKDCKFEYIVSLDSNFINSEIYDDILLNSDNTFDFNQMWDGNYKFFVKACATNKIGKAYSEIINVTFPVSTSSTPIVLINSIDSISFNFVDVSASVNYNGGLNIIESGFCISSNPNPDILNSTVILSSNLSSFTERILNLADNNTYYVRAFATNKYSTGYSDEKTFSTHKIYNIGDIGPAGGLIFYKNLSGDNSWHFLEASQIDLTQQLIWSNSDDDCGVTSTLLGNGMNNTNSIFSFYGNNGNYAAKLALVFSSNSKSDWFLPSREELIEMFNNLYLSNLGSFSTNAFYWSSSQDFNFPQNAWAVKMLNELGNVSSQNKNLNLKVRPIRKF